MTCRSGAHPHADEHATDDEKTGGLRLSAIPQNNLTHFASLKKSESSNGLKAGERHDIRGNSAGHWVHPSDSRPACRGGSQTRPVSALRSSEHSAPARPTKGGS